MGLTERYFFNLNVKCNKKNLNAKEDVAGKDGYDSIYLIYSLIYSMYENTSFWKYLFNE